MNPTRRFPKMADLTVSFFFKKVNIRGIDGWDEVGIGGKRLVTASGRDRGLGGIRVARSKWKRMKKKKTLIEMKAQTGIRKGIVWVFREYGS